MGGSDLDRANSVQQTTDGVYIVAGDTESNDGDVSGNHGLHDAWVVKLNSSGALQWQKCLGGSSNDYANCVNQTNDGGYIVVGTTESSNGNVSLNHGAEDVWVVKLSSAGDIQWQRSLGGSGNDDATGIQQTSDRGYAVAGSTQSNDFNVKGNHGGYDYWIAKIPVDGVGVFRPGSTNGKFYLDLNRDGIFDSRDVSFDFGLKSDKPVIGDWNGDGKSEVGVFRPSTHTFYLDTNANRINDTADASFSFGKSTDIPITGDWNGDGKSEVGVFRPSTHTFYLDYDANRVQGAGDLSFSFGATGDTPVAGRW